MASARRLQRLPLTTAMLPGLGGALLVVATMLSSAAAFLVPTTLTRLPSGLGIRARSATLPASRTMLPASRAIGARPSVACLRMAGSNEGAGRVLRIMLADKVSADALEALRGDGHSILYDPALSGESLAKRIADFGPQVLVVRSTKVPREALTASESLEVVIRAGAGVDNIELPAAQAAGVVVGNCAGANAAAVAELCWGLILAADRGLVKQDNDLKEGKWRKGTHGVTSTHRGLAGRTIGIAGYGSIGQTVAKRAVAFDMRVCAWSRSTASLPPGEALPHGAHPCVTLEELASLSDVVTVHLPSSKDTDGLLGDAFFGAMREGAIFINMARGSIVQDEALIKAMDSRGIKGASDVFDGEPAAPSADFNSTLAKHPRMTGTHHVGAATLQAEEAVADRMLEVIGEYARTGEVITRIV